MAIPYYDNLPPEPVDGVTCLVEVERVYLLDWVRFGEADWGDLTRLFEGLPRAIPAVRPGFWTWFGDDEDAPPFLSASVETPGLQVYGVLPEADWWAWDGRFRAGAAGLPCRAPR